MCRRVMPIRFVPPSSVGISIQPCSAIGLVILRNLVALGQVGIEVVLARESRMLVHIAVQRQRGEHGHLDGALIQDGQRAGQAEAHRADVGVGSAPKLVEQPQKILVSVRSWTWTSRPMTGSYLARTSGERAVVSGAALDIEGLKVIAPGQVRHLPSCSTLSLTRKAVILRISGSGNGLDSGNWMEPLAKTTRRALLRRLLPRMEWDRSRRGSCGGRTSPGCGERRKRACSISGFPGRRERLCGYRRGFPRASFGLLGGGSDIVVDRFGAHLFGHHGSILAALPMRSNWS